MEDEKEPYGIIYLITNKINNKIYIGQTINGFDKRYVNGNIEKYTHNEHLKNSIQKYGIDNFYIDKEFDIAYSQEELDKLEDMYIRVYNTINPSYGYNKRYGGNNSQPSNETKQKMSQNHWSKNGGIAWNKGKIWFAQMGHKNPDAKAVVCITTRLMFKTVTNAGHFYGCDNSNIAKVCRGKIKYCGKLKDGTPLKWMYYENYIKREGVA